MEEPNKKPDMMMIMIMMMIKIDRNMSKLWKMCVKTLF